MKQQQHVAIRYEDAVTIVALNDNPQDLSVRSIAGTVSVQLLSDIYGASATFIAQDIVRVRKHAQREERGL